MGDLRTRQSTLAKPRRPHVAVIADSRSSYGRAIIRGITRYANMHRQWILFRDSPEEMAEYDTWPRFDGVIIQDVAESPVLARTRRECKAVIHCSGTADPALGPMVAIDDHVAGRMAAEHLVECGFEHFGFYGQSDYLVSAHRLEGFREVIAAKGFAFHECPIQHFILKRSEKRLRRAKLIRWLREIPKPIGILGHEDLTANELLEACLEADIAVPDQVGVIGVNNDDLLCDSAWPPLTSVDGDFSRVGYRAAEVVDLLMRKVKLSPAQKVSILPPVGVVQRQSTNTLNTKNMDVSLAIRFIREHCCDPCTVDDVLRFVPIGRRWLEKLFRQQLGHSPLQEITKARMQVAKSLLVHSELGVDAVAARCGYADRKNFYLTFRRAFDQSPARYRKSIRLNGSSLKSPPGQLGPS